MKKFITIFPIIVILIMSNMVGIYANATYDTDTIADVLYNTSIYGIDTRTLGVSPNDFITKLGFDSDTIYLWWQYG